MRQGLPSMRMLVLAAIATGALALGSAGAAGASAPALTATPSGAAQPAPGTTGRLAHFSCTRAPRVLARIQKAEEGIAAGLPKLHAAEARATAAGNTRKAARIQQVITRLGRPGMTTRLQRFATAIEGKCSIAAPTAPGA